MAKCHITEWNSREFCLQFFSAIVLRGPFFCSSMTIQKPNQFNAVHILYFGHIYSSKISITKLCWFKYNGQFGCRGCFVVKTGINKLHIVSVDIFWHISTDSLIWTIPICCELAYAYTSFYIKTFFLRNVFLPAFLYSEAPVWWNSCSTLVLTCLFL